MTNRAEAANATAERILDAATELFWERPTDQIVLRDVAERAGVTVQTVIRKFGGKEALLAAAAERAHVAHRRRARRARPGTSTPRSRCCSTTTSGQGRNVLRLLAEEHSSPTLARYAEEGRVLHRDWCRTVFAPTLEVAHAAWLASAGSPSSSPCATSTPGSCSGSTPDSAADRPRSPSTSCSGRSCTTHR